MDPWFLRADGGLSIKATERKMEFNITYTMHLRRMALRLSQCHLSLVDQWVPSGEADWI